MSGVRVLSDISAERIDAAARIWADATAARDDSPTVAPLDLARPVITAVIESSPGAILLTALERGDVPLGFVVSAPSGHERAELHYLGVSPGAWGRGIGTILLTAFARHLRAAGFALGELWVYRNNYPAVMLYETLGWRFDGPTRVHPRSGRTEVHYTLDLV